MPYPRAVAMKTAIGTCKDNLVCLNFVLLDNAQGFSATSLFATTTHCLMTEAAQSYLH